MNRFTIQCTPKQTKKALELGAPIVAKRKFSIDWKEGKRVPYPDVERDEKGKPILIPVTAEQMIGWLRKEKGLFVEPYLNGECCYSFSPIVSTKEDGEIIHLEAEDDPDKATFAAIDAALEYLANNTPKHDNK